MPPAVATSTVESIRMPDATPRVGSGMDTEREVRVSGMRLPANASWERQASSLMDVLDATAKPVIPAARIKVPDDVISWVAVIEPSQPRPGLPPCDADEPP